MRFRSPPRHRGFTLFEVLISILMLGILSALALPTYQTYLKKAKMAEVFMAIGPAQLAANEYALNHEGFADFSDAWIETKSHSAYIDLIQVKNAAQDLVVLGIQLSQALVNADEAWIYFVGHYGPEGIDWQCQVPRTSSEVLKIAPSSCHEGS